MEYVRTIDDYDENDLDAMENCFQEAWDGFTTYTFLNSMQSDYSGKMLEDCSNTYALTREDKFPKTIGAATKAVEKYKNAINVRRTSNKSYQKNGSNSNGHNSRLRGPNNNENQNRNEDNVELQTGFAQQGTRQNGNNGHKSNIRCFACQQFGHYANECPQITRNPQNGSINAQAGEQTDNNNPAQDSNQNGNQNGNGQPRIGRQGAGFLLVQNVNQTIQTPNLLPPNSKKQALKAIVLNQQNKFSDLRQQEMLDSESTDHIYCNSDLLYDIQQVDATLNLQSNGGIISTNWMGKHRQHHFWCWYDDEAISNVISLGKIRESGRFHVSYDFDKGIFTLKNLQTGQETFFHMNEVGLHVTPLNPQAVSMLTTVEDNKALYTKRQIAGAEKARALYQVIGYPSLRDFLHLLQTNQIKNCPVTAEDVKICQKIYGPDVYALKGKTVRHKPRAVVNDYLEIPRELISAHQGIILFADVMFIDGVPMMVTLSKNVRLITITYIPLRDKDTLLWALDDVFRKYNMSGFEIKEFHADPEFQCVTKELEDNGITCNICAAEEHVPDIERIIRVIKERYRAMYHAAPFSMWTKLMVIRGAANVAKWLNTFPPSGGISPTYSPRSIITGRPLDYDKHCKISFGSYVEATTQNTPTNTLEERTITGILLNTLDNIQGGYEVLNLKTGKPITRHHVKELPLTPDIIARVEHLAKRDGFKPHAEPIFRTCALIAGVGESHDSEDITLSDDDYEWQDQDDISIESLESIDEQELLDLANEIDLTPGVQQPITQPVHNSHSNKSRNQPIVTIRAQVQQMFLTTTNKMLQKMVMR